MKTSPLAYVHDPGFRINWPVKIAIAFFAVSVALENTASTLVHLPATLPTIATIVLIAAFLFFFPKHKNAGRPDIAFRYLVIFALLAGLGELIRFLASDRIEYFRESLVYFKLILAFYILDVMVSRSAKAFRIVVYSWVAVLCLLAVLAVLRVDWIFYNFDGRIGIKGENLNIAGHRWAGIVVGMAAYLMKKRRVLSRGNLAMLLMMGILTIAAFQSGSRGASIALIAGLAGFSVFDVELRLKRVTKYVLMCVALSILLYGVFLRTDILVDRWSTKVASEDAGLRTSLNLESLKLIMRNPMFGYGSDYDVLLGRQLNRIPIVSHNTLTQVPLTSGIFLLIPFVLAIAVAFKRSMRSTVDPLGMAICAAFITALVSSMFGNWVFLKYFWLVLILAANTSVLKSASEGS